MRIVFSPIMRVTGKSPEYINKLFRLNSEHDSRRTRSSHFSFPYVREREADYSFTVTFVKANAGRNNLPMKFGNSSSKLTIFKNVYTDIFFLFKNSTMQCHAVSRFRTKTCTDRPFDYTGPAEPGKVLNGIVSKFLT